MSLEVLHHQLASECDITWGFLVFPFLPVLVSCPTTAGGTPAGAERVVRFLSPWALACPARCRQGPEILAARACRQPGRGLQENSTGWGEGETFGYGGFGCHLLVWFGPGLGWHSAGHLCVFSWLAWLCSALNLLCFGFALVWICSWLLLSWESPSDGVFMDVTKSDTQPRQEAPARVCPSRLD